MDSHTALACVTGLLLLAAGVAASPIAADWQLKRLLEPSPSQRAAEARGAVMIYDGLDAGLVETAMERHFDRIQNMMFIRIHHRVAADDNVEIEDDGCD